MSRGLSTSPPSAINVYSGIQSKTPTFWRSPVVVLPPRMSLDHPLCSSDFKLKPNRFAGLSCNSSSTPGGPGENDSRSVLDAFFLGKALAEAISERIESTVGEFLSTVGRLQAEQQKQVQDLQEEVMERARRAKEKAAREAMEAQGLIPMSSTENVSVVADGVASKAAPSDVEVVAPTISPNSIVATDPEGTQEDFIYEVSKDE